MDMSVLAIDLDGTLRNPLIAGVLALYSFGLASIAYLVASRVRSGRLRIPIAALVGALLVLGAFFNVSVVRGLVATFVESSSTFHGTVGVGFFGHHPPWIAPAIAVIAALFGTTRGSMPWH
jgi:hypothetical protein